MEAGEVKQVNFTFVLLYYLFRTKINQMKRQCFGRVKLSFHKLSSVASYLGCVHLTEIQHTYCSHIIYILLLFINPYYCFVRTKVRRYLRTFTHTIKSQCTCFFERIEVRPGTSIESLEPMVAREGHFQVLPLRSWIL